MFISVSGDHDVTHVKNYFVIPYKIFENFVYKLLKHRWRSFWTNFIENSNCPNGVQFFFVLVFIYSLSW